MELNGIGFENFRVFKDYSQFEFAPAVTVLTGANSSGKSTIIKALKLMQSFWSQSGFGHHLNFEKENHQLGDFEMCRSKNSKEDEIKITYQVNHILFDTPLTVELLFQLDEIKSLNDISLKNGILDRMRIKLEREIIYSLKIEDKNFWNGFNYKYIIQSLLPKMKETYLNLQTEYKKYCEKIYKCVEETNGIRFIGEDAVKKANINEDRYYKLMTLFTEDFSKKYPEPTSAESGKMIGDYKKYPFIYELEILDLFSQIPKSESVFFVDAFWKLLIQKHPDIENKYNYATFKNFIEQEEEQGHLHINSWKETFLMSKNDNFKDFLKEQINLAIDESSRMLLSNPLGIADIGIFGYSKFFEVSNLDMKSSFDLKGNVISQNLFLWSNMYYYITQTQSGKLNDSQKAIINCQEIFLDAIYFEKKLLNIENDSSIDKVLGTLKTFFINVFKQIESDSKNMYFIDSIRAFSQRFYAYDSQVSNFNSFITDFLKQKYTEQEESFLKKWLKEFEIADNCDIELIEGAGSQIFLEKDKEKINLVDLGYGVTQFLPILLKIIYCNNSGKKTIVIEEPETNLHPKFQSKLADLFMDAYKTFGIRFIIETHSEYLIRKLQYLTAKGEIMPENTVLYYIGNPDSSKREQGEKQIIKIHIEKNGQLSHPFGSGFTDESLRWLKAMFTFNNN